jgi:hypothetical protein
MSASVAGRICTKTTSGIQRPIFNMMLAPRACGFSGRPFGLTLVRSRLDEKEHRGFLSRLCVRRTFSEHHLVRPLPRGKNRPAQNDASTQMPLTAMSRDLQQTRRPTDFSSAETTKEKCG